MHLGANVMALVGRLGLVRDWSVHAERLKRWSDRLLRFGSDAGAMHVAARGLDADGRPVQRTWTLIATHGDGPWVPVLAAAALVRRLAAGRVPAAGARPCVGELTLDDFERELGDRHIAWSVA